MDPERWQRIGEIMSGALEHPPVERQIFLDEACGDDHTLRREVESLLHADENAGAFLGQPLWEEPTDDRGAWAGRRLGPYRLLHKIGEGGMSTVYLALRDDDQYQRRVAIKLIRFGVEREDLRRRFHRERQILASLDHPNIARMFDGDTTEEGVPYVVMEYIEGQPVDVYCDRHTLTIRQRLELFRTVCSAVHYAHQNLVVHRDLKPGNILVTADGEPKLLDFGIAKLLDPDLPGPDPTETWQRVLTPDYASPEQVQGKVITTASDVYSLGILLYKLLTGRPPHRFADKSPLEIERILTRGEPERPSIVVFQPEETGAADGRKPAFEEVCQARRARPEQLRRQLVGDVDHIVLKSLRPEPPQRYGSVEQFAEDLRRHLVGQPVLARGATFSYRFGKFIRRHKVAVSVVLLIAALLAGFAAMMAIQSARVSRERDVARLERDKSRQALAFIEGIFEGADPGESRGEELTAYRIVERGTERVFEELREQPEIQASIVNSLGNIHRNLGLYERADELLRTALETRRAALGSAHSDVAESLNDLALLLIDQGKMDAAEPLLHEALAIRSQTLGEEHSETGETLNNIGLIEDHKGHYDNAEAYYRRGLEINRKTFGEEHGRVALSLSNLATALFQQGETDQAEAAYLAALLIQRKLFGDLHPQIGVTLTNLGHLHRVQSEFDEAERVFREALVMRRELFGDEHLDIAVSLNNLALVLEEKGDDEQAEQLLTDALAMWIRLFGKDNQRSATIHYNLGNIYRGKGDAARAEEFYRESLDIFARTVPEVHPYVAVVHKGLGRLLLEEGRLEEALTALTRSVEIARQALPPGHTVIAQAESLLGACLTRLARYDEAEPLLLESYRQTEGRKSPNDPETVRARERVVALYEAWGKPEKAASYRMNPPRESSDESTR